MKVSYSNFHPFVRKVGIGSNIHQSAAKIAYDYRLICALEGNGRIEYNGNNQLFLPCDLLLIKPGIPYRINSTEKQVLAVVNFDCTYAYSQVAHPVPSVYAEHFSEGSIIDHSDLSQLFEGYSDDLICVRGNEEVNQLLLRMYQVFMSAQGSTKAKQLFLSSLLEQVVAFMMEASLLKSNKNNSVAEKIYLYIRCHYAEPLTLCELSKVFHFHGNYINRLLRSRYNVSFHKMLVIVRLEQAIALLESTDYTVSEIAEQTGFGSLRQLTDYFKKTYGMTPSEYRKKKEVSFSLI